MSTVTVYTRPGCGPCLGVKRHLTRLGVDFVEVDLATNEQAVEALKAAGALQAPVVIYEGAIWGTGYNPERLEKLAEVIQHPWPEEAPGAAREKARRVEEILAREAATTEEEAAA